MGGRIRLGLALAVIAAFAGGGCGIVPRSRLEEAHKRCQVLQAEADHWKDAAARLRDQNRDYAQRAVDDARRVQVVEESNARLEKEVVGYQEDVRRMEEAFDTVKRQVQAAAAGASATARGGTGP